jgi:hypothetical protein
MCVESGYVLPAAANWKGDRMSIFDRLKNAILGTRLHAGPVETGSPTQAAQPAAPASQASGQAPRPTPAQTAPAAGPGTQVDIEAVLIQMAESKHEKLNWQTSIVDLMKLVDLDPSLENRKMLAGELGYTGNTQDSASMNIWLHKEVMQKLAASGGKVPDSLRH